MRSKYVSPDKCCPICGTEVGELAENYSRHRCSQKSLAAIDAANTRSSILSEEENFDYFPQPSDRERLADGFKLLSDELND